MIGDPCPTPVSNTITVETHGRSATISWRPPRAPAHYRSSGCSAVSYAGEETTLATARAKVLPDPLHYLIPLSPAARTESYER